MSTSNPIRLKNLSLAELREAIASTGEPPFRADQVIRWLYRKRVGSFDQMRNISASAREKFSSRFSLAKLYPETVIESPRGDAVKFGLRLLDSPHLVECVLLIDGSRRTACLSSQLGCGLGCTFCETGRLGFIRNLAQDEILGQLIGINDYLAEKSEKLITNIVFMGMGEALSNFEAFRSSLSIIMDEECFGIGGRHITVSTAGVIPSIERLLKEKLNIGLAISLNAYSNKTRSAVMPVNRKYPIESLIEIAIRYHRETGRPVTFEYVLVDGQTETTEAASALKRLLGGIHCKINCIPVNPLSGSKAPTAATPSRNRQIAFVEKLKSLGLAATLRSSRGEDISGACGQLTSREGV